MRNTLLVATAAAAVTLGAMPAQAQQAGDVLFRVRAIMVAPNEDAGPVTPSFPTGSVDVDNAYAPEVDFTYMFTNNIGAELILGTTKHGIGGTDALAGLGNVATTWVLPPTLTLQYHFAPESHIRPYVGAGINYTIFYSSNPSDSLESAIGQTDVSLDDSFGYALQAGIDFDITPRIFGNIDVKYIDMDTTATLTTAGVGQNKVDVSIDPLVFGIGIGLRL